MIIEFAEPMVSISKRELDEKIVDVRAEVAREIFEEIERFLKNQESISENKRLKEVGDWIFHDYLPRQLAELKKKYMQPEPTEGD